MHQAARRPHPRPDSSSRRRSRETFSRSNDQLLLTMLSRLLGLLLLSSLGSAMMPVTGTTMQATQNSTEDNTEWYGSGSMSEEVSDSFLRGLSKGLGGPGSVAPPLLPSGVTPMPPMPPMPPILPVNGTGGRMLGEFPPQNPDVFCDFMLHSPNPPTIDQIPPYCICSYCKGQVGPKGDRGDPGPRGFPGSPGRRGMTGFKGQRGFTGLQGIKGQKGDFGEKGQPGGQGFSGMKGDRGFKGQKGDRGMIGPGGSQGPQGETGTCPASCESVPGPPGSQGTPGSVGARGLPGVPGPVGPKGFKGDKGDLGRPGDPGRNGIKGDQGEQGLCECTDGEDGADGGPGVKGDKGAKGDTGAEGTQGPIGLTGDRGDMGHVGPPGPCSPAIQSAFSASINQSYPRENYPVPFTKVLTNQQGHFNPTMGIYTAPVNGTYVLSFHLSVNGRILKVGIFLNFYPIVRMTEATDQSTTSQTVVVHLTMGDRLWLQVKDGISNGIFTDSESSSTFSGYLLHPDSCRIPIGRKTDGHTTPGPNMKGSYSWDGPGGNATTTTPTPTTTP